LFGTDSSSSSSYSPWHAPSTETRMVDVKPVDQPWDKAPAATYTSPFDEAQKLIDASPAAQFGEPKADVTPAVHVDAPVADSPMPDAFHFDAPSAPDRSWMSAFDEPAHATPAVAKTSEEPKANTDWSARWSSPASDQMEPGIRQVLDSPWDAPAAQPVKAVVDTPKKSKADEDSIARMRRLFSENSLLQKSKKGHMVSVKLYRSK